jgi:alginate O-acetyltransferase complex protein AlgI
VFMKSVIADNCAVTVNTIFAGSSIYTGSTLILGIFLFSVQIYADFAGYSNIAIGLGKLLGFHIMQNFAFPYFSRDIRAFWKRWNISLTGWFRDYLFLPIAYSVSRKMTSARFYFIKTEFIIYAIAVTITWVLTGLWHGANNTFIIWGLIQGCFLVLNHILAKRRKRTLKRLKISNDNILLIVADTLATFMIVMFSWIFFRAGSVGQAFDHISRIFSMSSFTVPEIIPKYTMLLVALFSVVEWLGRDHEYAIATVMEKWPGLARWMVYNGIVLAIIIFAASHQEFIYFQF